MTESNHNDVMQRRSGQSGGHKGFLILTRIWTLVFLSLTAFACVKLYQFGLLPMKWIIIAISVAVVVAILLSIPMVFKAFKHSRRVFCFVLSILIAGAGTYGWYNLDKTTQFLSQVTTSLTEQTLEYYVVVKKDSAYQKVSDLDGVHVLAYSKGNDADGKARDKLQKDVNVTFTYKSNLSKLGKEVQTNPESAALLSAGNYSGIKEKDKTFKSNTRILRTIKVKTSAMDLSKNVSVTKKAFNIYVSGLDTWGTIDTVSRSDVNMIVTVNPETHKILLTSIPRDYVIKLTEKQDAEDKLTHTGIYGIQQTLASVEELTGLDMNYYVKVNYSTVCRIIDAIGGVDVTSDQAFITHGQRYFEFKEGKNHLNGREALAFARERHAFEDGDLQRNRDQAKVMEAMIKKITSSKTLLTHYASILDSSRNYMQVNMSKGEISSLVKMQLKDGKKWTIKKQGLTGESELVQCYSTGNYQVYAMRPDQKSVDEAVEKIVDIQEGK